MMQNEATQRLIAGGKTLINLVGTKYGKSTLKTKQNRKGKFKVSKYVKLRVIEPS